MPGSPVIPRSEWTTITERYASGEKREDIARSYGVRGPAIVHIVKACLKKSYGWTDAELETIKRPPGVGRKGASHAFETTPPSKRKAVKKRLPTDQKPGKAHSATRAPGTNERPRVPGEASTACINALAAAWKETTVHRRTRPEQQARVPSQAAVQVSLQDDPAAHAVSVADRFAILMALPEDDPRRAQEVERVGREVVRVAERAYRELVRVTLEPTRENYWMMHVALKEFGRATSQTEILLFAMRD